MRKLLITAVAAGFVTGCATPVPGPQINIYSYESQQHSGYVQVHEKAYTSKRKICPDSWRSGDQHQPKGIPGEYESNLKLDLALAGSNADPVDVEIQIPAKLGEKIVLRDLQQHKEYAINSDSHGFLFQGDHFFHPEGYVVRVGHMEINKWNIQGCVAIDHMYVTSEELASGEPAVYLDRLVVPYSQNNGDPVRVSFGRYNDLEATIRIKP